MHHRMPSVETPQAQLTIDRSQPIAPQTDVYRAWPSLAAAGCQKGPPNTGAGQAPRPDDVVHRSRCPGDAASTGSGFEATSQSGLPAPFSEVWDGAAWTVVRTGHPPEDFGQLEGVSCTSADFCMAVGGYDNYAFARRWDGSSWSASPVPHLKGNNDDLYSVSCVSPTGCVAVGIHDVTSSISAPILAQPDARKWNGTTWSRFDSVTPGGFVSALMSVSCLSMTSCAAVGLHNQANATRHHALVQ